MAVEKVKAAGYKPLVNEGGSTTSEDTLKNAVNNSKEEVETTSWRKNRPKFVRQKSFEIDSDSTDNSLADVSGLAASTTAASEAVTATNSKRSQPQNKLPTLQEE